MKLRAIIVDDEKPAILRLQQILDAQGGVEVVGSFTKPSALLEALPKLKPDVAFLDIDMPGKDGLELAALLHELQQGLEIVFVTAYNQYALEAFRVNAIDYLLKPVNPDILSDTLRRVSDRMKRELAAGQAYRTGRTDHASRTEGADQAGLAGQVGRANQADRADQAGNSSAARVQCLGGIAVVGKNGAQVRFPTQKAEELFAYLLIHRGGDVSKWTVCESLWPESEPEKAAHNLHTAIYRMKKTLQEYGVRIRLESRKGTYRFELLDPCDYVRLNDLLERSPSFLYSNAEASEQVLRQYRGSLFGDKGYLWSEFEKERIYHGVVEKSVQLACEYIDTERVQQAHDLLQWLLEQAPYEEEAYELLLGIYIARQDRVSFLKLYRRMESMMLKGLGTAPSTPLKQLYRRMLEELG